MYLGEATCKITIADKYVLRGVNAIEIKSSVHQLIQTAKVTLPLSVVLRNTELYQRIKIADKIKEGDKILLEFGYNGNNKQEFEGYVKRINEEVPLELQCEDELYLLRYCYYKESFKDVTLKKLLDFVLNGLQQKFNLKLYLYEKMPELSFNKFQINNATGIDILQELKDKYGLSVFLTVINGVKTLYAGLAYGLEKGAANYWLGKNTIGKGELKYTGAEDKKYKVKVVNFNRNGTKLEFETGDANGESTTLYFYGNNDKAHLEVMAKAELEKFKTKGYKGSFETFLYPFAEAGTVASINDAQFEGRKGNYFIGTVTTKFGVQGGRRTNEIDIKVTT